MTEQEAARQSMQQRESGQSSSTPSAVMWPTIGGAPNREYGFSPAESAFLMSWDNAMIWDFKREGDALFRHLQVS